MPKILHNARNLPASMYSIVYTFQRLEGDFEDGLEVRNTIRELGGIADWNPSLKDWEARFEGVPESVVGAHKEIVLQALLELSGICPTIVSVAIESG